MNAPAPKPSPLTDKCAWAAQEAFQAHSRMETALYAAEYALDEVARVQKALDAARAQLSAAIAEVRKREGALRVMAYAFIEKMTAKGDANG